MKKHFPVRRDPPGAFPADAKLNAYAEINTLHTLIGRITTEWANIDQQLSRGITSLTKQHPNEIAEPNLPSRFDERLKRFKLLARKYCDSERSRELLDEITLNLKDWTNLRDDFAHGKVEPYFSAKGDLRAHVVPSVGRTLKPDRAYTISVNDIQFGLLMVAAGFGGRITAIIHSPGLKPSTPPRTER